MAPNRIKVYVAGPYSAHNVISVLDNMNRGIRVCTELLLKGYAPFCPWIDFHFHLSLRDGESLTVQDYYDYSLAWLYSSDAVFMIGEWQKSVGAMEEYKRSMEMGLPVFTSYGELNKWRGERDGV